MWYYKDVVTWEEKNQIIKEWVEDRFYEIVGCIIFIGVVILGLKIVGMI